MTKIFQESEISSFFFFLFSLFAFPLRHAQYSDPRHEGTQASAKESVLLILYICLSFFLGSDVTSLFCIDGGVNLKVRGLTRT